MDRGLESLTPFCWSPGLKYSVLQEHWWMGCKKKMTAQKGTKKKRNDRKDEPLTNQTTDSSSASNHKNGQQFHSL